MGNVSGYEQLKAKIEDLEQSRAEVAANLSMMARRVMVLSKWVAANGGNVNELLADLNIEPAKEVVNSFKHALADMA